MDLSLISTDEIIAELDKRFDTVCLLTRKILSAKAEEPRYHYYDQIGCLGLMSIAIRDIKNSYAPNKSNYGEDGG